MSLLDQRGSKIVSAPQEWPGCRCRPCSLRSRPLRSTIHMSLHKAFFKNILSRRGSWSDGLSYWSWSPCLLGMWGFTRHPVAHRNRVRVLCLWRAQRIDLELIGERLDLSHYSIWRAGPKLVVRWSRKGGVWQVRSQCQFRGAFFCKPQPTPPSEVVSSPAQHRRGCLILQGSSLV